VYEAILDVVELINVLHNFMTPFRYKVLDKSVSANGNPKANVAVVYKGLGGEQRTEVGEGGISSKQALCGRVRLSRRDTPDKNLGLVVDIQASVLLENQLDVREHLERNGELGLDVTVIGVCYCAGVLVVLVEGATPEVMDGEAKDNHLEGVSLLSAGLAPGVKYVPAKVEVTQVGLGGAHCFEVLKHSTQIFANSLNIVTLL
jgi:hypothetical protein